MTMGDQYRPSPGQLPPPNYPQAPMYKARRVNGLAISGMIIAALGVLAAAFAFWNAPLASHLEVEKSPEGLLTGSHMVRDDSYVIGYFAVPIVLSVLGSALAVAGLVRTRSLGSGSVPGVLGVLAGLLGSAIAVLGIITAL